jgi:hypothetical protein
LVTTGSLPVAQATSTQKAYQALLRLVDAGRWEHVSEATQEIDGATRKARELVADLKGVARRQQVVARALSEDDRNIAALGRNIADAATSSGEDGLAREARCIQLGWKRQRASLTGQRVLARYLLRQETEGTPLTDNARTAVYVDELLGREGPSSGERIEVVGLARPSVAGHLEVSDAASETVIWIADRLPPIERGRPVRVSGIWHESRRCLIGARLEAAAPALGAAAADGLLSQLGTELGLTEKAASPRARSVARPISPAGTVSCRDDTSDTSGARFCLEEALSGSKLSIGTLCDVHASLIATPGPAGRLRVGPAVIQLAGAVHFVPPADGGNRATLQAYVNALNRAISACRSPADTVVLAADFAVRLTELHPFADGNGRVSRVLASSIVRLAGYRPRPEKAFDAFCHRFRSEYFVTQRHYRRDCWSWYQFVGDAVLSSFEPPWHCESAQQ